MADFRVLMSGVTVETWEDPALAIAPFTPTRINPLPEHVHRRFVAEAGDVVGIVGQVNGLPAPLDGLLGGRLFTAFMVEHPTGVPPALTHPPGQSSLQQFTPVFAGHYTVRMVREDGGGVFVHVDVVEP